MGEEIFRISRDKTRAKDLVEMANERMTDIITIIPKDKAYKILEEYYEVLVQLMTAIMYADGYKTISHISLIKYIEKNNKELSKPEIFLIDQIRKFRHGTVYYGKKISDGFLINNKELLTSIISKLFKIAKNKINWKISIFIY